MKKIIQNVTVLSIGILLVGSIAPSRLRFRTVAGPMPLTTTAAGPTLESVRALASLVTTKVSVSDVQLTELRGYVGGAKAVLLVRGDFTLGTNLARAHFTDVDSVARTLTVELEQPTADNPRVDLSRTRLVAVTTEGLWDVVPGHSAETVVTDDSYREAQTMVLRISQESAWRRQSQEQAEHVLRTFFTSVAWKVNVRWQGEKEVDSLRSP